MKKIMFLIIFLILINIAIATKINSTNYNTNIIINSGGENLSSENYKTIITIGEELISNLSSANYKTELGILNTFLLDKTLPIITLVSPEDLYSSSSATVSFVYNVSDDNLYKCYLYWGDTNVLNNSNTTSNQYTLTYETQQASGSNYWYISCQDKANNYINSTTRYISFSLQPSFTSGSAKSYRERNEFAFINLNQFGSSYIHRTDDNPTPDQKVDFSVYITNPSISDNITFFYSIDNKMTWETNQMAYDSTLGNFNTQIGAYPAKTLVYYYVQGVRDNIIIRTPSDFYEILVWDNPPIQEEIASEKDYLPLNMFNFGLTAVGFTLTAIGVFIIIIILTGIFIIYKRNKSKGD